MQNVVQRNKVIFFDTEYPTRKTQARLGNPYDPANKVVAYGYRKTHEPVQGKYFGHDGPGLSELDLPLLDCRIIVGVNLKADLPWIWRSPSFLRFIKEGGEAWDCAYAEYLLTGQRWSLKRPKDQRPSMVNMYRKYRRAAERAGDFSEAAYDDGKMDEVTALWGAGVDTADIPQDLLMEYLLGSENHDSCGTRADGALVKGDIAMTEYIFHKQVARAKALGMLTMIRESMDSLLATQEMEYNGLKVDRSRMERNIVALSAKAAGLLANLNEMLPALPEGLEFNWGSGAHLSALIYGGPIKYPAMVQRTDKDGQLLWEKDVAEWPVFKVTYTEEVAQLDAPTMPEDGPVLVRHTRQRTKQSPVDPATCLLLGHVVTSDLSGEDEQPADMYWHPSFGPQIRDAKAHGRPKYKAVKLDSKRPALKKGSAVVILEGMTKPHHMWKTAEVVKTDDGEFAVYKTDDDVLNKLASKVPFCKALRDYRAVTKDLTTYFTGNMLLLNPHDGCIHHNIQTHVTETSRFSADKPNLQNVPGMNKSDFRACLVTRFADGVMAEPDYSQLEKVGQQVMTQDPALKEDLLRGVDFHCMNLAFKEGVTYEDVIRFVKEQCLADWIQKRKDIKEYTFQEAYGAGPKSMAEAVGCSVDDIKRLQAAARERYVRVADYFDEVEQSCVNTRQPTGLLTQGGMPKGIGYYTTPMGLRFVFEERDAPKFLKERGIHTCFYRPHIMNYPVQGSCGYFVRMALGRLFRWLAANDFFGFEVLLVNTVHDCVWFDMRQKWLAHVMPTIRQIMQDIPKYLIEQHNMTVEVPFPVEAEVGVNMGELEHWDWKTNAVRVH